MNTTTASAPAGRVNFVTGIVVAHLDRNRIEKTLADNRISYTSDQDTEQLSVLLWEHFFKQPKDNLGKCERCRGISSNDQDLCPYCGHDTAIDLEPADLASSRPKAQEATPMTTQQTNPAVETNGATKLATTEKKSNKAVHTEAELDQAVADVQQLKSAAAVSYWHLGKKIAHIYDGMLWKLRVAKDDKGKERPRWKSFEAFCNEELGMTPDNAHTLRDVAAHYSETDVRKFGTSKLGLVLRAPPEDRAELEEKVKAGAGYREIQGEVIKRKKKAGYTKPSKNKRTAKATAASTKKSREKKPEPKLTVAKLLGSTLVKLYEKPATMKGIDVETIKKLPRAKKIGDGAIGIVELTNDVSEYFNLFTSPSGELVIKIVRARED